MNPDQIGIPGVTPYAPISSDGTILQPNSNVRVTNQSGQPMSASVSQLNAVPIHTSGQWTVLTYVKALLAVTTPTVAVLAAAKGPITQESALLAIAAGLSGFRAFLDTSLTS